MHWTPNKYKKKTKNIDIPLNIFPARVPREKQYENSPIFLQLDVLFIYLLAYYERRSLRRIPRKII